MSKTPKRPTAKAHAKIVAEAKVVVEWTVMALTKESRSALGNARYEGKGWTLEAAISALNSAMKRRIKNEEGCHKKLVMEMEGIFKETTHE